MHVEQVVHGRVGGGKEDRVADVCAVNSGNGHRVAKAPPIHPRVVRATYA